MAEDAEKPGRAPKSLDLSVVVVTHNRAELALAALRSAREAATGVDVEWLVVDSGSTDGTPEAIECALPGIEVLRRSNIGFAAANNEALRRARGRYVLLLNPDVEIREGSFAGLLAALEERPGTGIASVIQQATDGTLQHSIRRYPSPRLALGEALAIPVRGWREEETRDARYREERTADWLVGAFLVARAQAVEEIGLLDERFFMYSEEIDWCLRARACGWDVRHLPTMVVAHHTARTTDPDLAAQLSYAKLLFARKHYRRWRAIAIRAALALRHLIRWGALAVAGRWHPSGRARRGAERRALVVMLGLAPPPFASGDKGRSGSRRPQRSVDELALPKLEHQERP